MHKLKAQQFRKQIRRQQLNQYFKKKRKQLLQIQRASQSTQMQTIKRLNQQIHKTLEDNKMIGEKFVMDMDDLVTIAKFSQTQIGVQCLLKTDIPVLVLPFLTSAYYNRSQQHLATGIFTNITYVKTQKLPSHQFLRNISNIIENTLTQQIEQKQLYQQQKDFFNNNNNTQTRMSTQQLMDTIDNCLLIVYHLMVDFTEVIRFYVEECGLVNLLNGILQAQVSLPCIEKVLKILTFINQYYLDKANKKPVRKFLKFYLNIIQNSNEFRFIFLSLTNIQSLMSIYCQSIQQSQSSLNNKSSSFTQTQKQFSDIQSQIEKSHFLSRINAIYNHVAKKKLMTRQILNILRMLIPGLTLKTMEEKIYVLLGKVIDEIYTEKQLMNQNQQQHETNQAMDLKILFYQVIYQILSVLASHHQSFTKNILFNKICQRYHDFEATHSTVTEDQKSLRKGFIHIFGMLTFSGNIHPQEHHLLKVSIDRYKYSKENDFDGEDPSSSDFQAFIETVETNLNELQVDQF